MVQRTLELTYDTPFSDAPTRRKPVVSLTRTDIAVRYPRLIHALQLVACLSEGEAISCICDYQRGDRYSGEAVNHYGGTKKVIFDASRARVRYASTRLRHQLDAALATLAR